MTSWQMILSKDLSENNFSEIFNQSDLSFPVNDEAHELSVIGKDNTFKVISQVELASCVRRKHDYMCHKHQVFGNDLVATCPGALYLRSEPEVQKHCRLERKPAIELIYQISDLEHLIYYPTPKVYTVYCKNGTKRVLHLSQATKVRIKPDCQENLDKHAITSDNIVNLATEPLYCDWSWDPLDMPVVILKDQGHADFMIINLRKFVTKVNEQSKKAYLMEDLLISNVSSSKSMLSKFLTFFWITSNFISISIF
jgi:hypothetical protein